MRKPPIFTVSLDDDGVFEPGFCSTCFEFQDVVLFAATPNGMICLCGMCIRDMALALIDARDTMRPSRA